MRPKILLIITIIALAASSAFIAYFFMKSLGQHLKTTVRHFCIKGSDSWAVGFILESSEDGFFSFIVYRNSSYPFIFSDNGHIRAGGSFTYTIHIKPEPSKTIIVNIKVWWGERLIDEVNHHIRADDG